MFLHVLTITSYFFSIIPCATPLYFNLPSIGRDDQNVHLKPEGKNSYISDQGAQITSDEISANRNSNAGRVKYIKPLHLWDRASGKQADFNTHFSFVINSNGSTSFADGLTFFLAQNSSYITAGGALGLPIDPQTINATASFVAVEFDTHWNSWDPGNESYPGPHAGININSMTSVTYEKWWHNITYGAMNEARISYNSTSKALNVVFTGYKDNAIFQQDGLNCTVDLSEVLPEWVIFGFTAATGEIFETNNVKSWEFNATEITVETPNPGPSPGPSATRVPPPDPVKPKNKIALVVGLSIGLCILVGGLTFLGHVLWKRRNGKKNDEEIGFELSMNDEFEMGSGPKKFSYEELARATNYFSEDKKLGEGGFGGVYRGMLTETNSCVAVKRVSKSSKQGIKEYASEVMIISRLRHRNLVQLIGWCHEKRELLLVYEFMENGSLDAHLFKEKSLLTWKMRYKIAQGLASALLYLHEEWEQCVVHRDLKSSNIMLDSNFNAKLGDFGLARLVDHEKGSQTTILAGTMGYMAPECVITGKASKESDVFSFGIVLLEIACGRRPIEHRVQENQVRMVEWVWDLYGVGKLHEAADPKLCSYIDVQEMERLMTVGLWCAHPDYNLRPSIRQAIHILNFEAPLPILPSKMPVPTYLSPPMSTTNYSVSWSHDNSSSGQFQSTGYSYGTDSSKLTSSSSVSSPSASLLHTK